MRVFIHHLLLLEFNQQYYIDIMLETLQHPFLNQLKGFMQLQRARRIHDFEQVYSVTSRTILRQVSYEYIRLY